MTTLQITFVSESAGYRNTLGWYNSRTGEAGIVFLDTNDDGRHAAIAPGTVANIEVSQSDLDAGNIGFFIIPDGAHIYGTGKKSVLNGPLSFGTKGNGDGQIIDAHGHKLRGEQGQIIFSDPKLNKKGTDYTQGDDDGSILGQIAFEDLVKKSDHDYNDLVVDVKIANPAAPVAEDDGVDGAVEDTALVIPAATLLANDHDADGDATIKIVAVDNATNGTVALLADGTIRFTPAQDYSGTATFSYTISDGSHTDTAKVTLNVRAVADQPIITTADVPSTGNDAIDLSIGVALADADGSETLGITISGVPADWSLSAGVRDEETGNYALTPAQLAGLSITPAPGAVGSATLTVVATATEAANGDAASGVATLTVSVAQEGAFQGHAIDGYIAGATVFADANDDGVRDEGEASATTDASGSFTLVGGSGPLVLSGGVDISTGQAFTGVLRAPSGATVVTPLTTLVAAGLTPGQLGAAFGLDASVDLLNFDPIPAVLAGGPGGAAAAQVMAAGIQVQNTIAQATALLNGAGVADAGAAVLAALADAVGSGAPVDLADPAQAQALLLAAGASADVAADAAQVIAETNAAVADALDAGSPVAVLESLAQAASVAQGESLAQALMQAGDSNDPSTLVDDYTGASLAALIAAAQAGDVDGGLVGTLGDDTLTGGPGNDAIDGLSGNDLLSGLGGNDQLYGGPGHDTLRGGAGNDVLNGGVLADFQSFAGFSDTDRADYSGAAGGVNVNLATGIAQDGDGGVDMLIGIEAVTGSAHDDILTGSGAFFEIFRGGAGDDIIDGAGGFDRAEYQDATAGIVVTLGALAPNKGTVTGDVSVGSDTLIDVVMVAGTDFADTYVATGFLSNPSPGALEGDFNSFEGRGGDDLITGNGGTRIDYFTATGAVSVNLVTGTATGNASVGTDTFTGVNQVRGTSYADTLTGGNPLSDDFEGFNGRGGNDWIDGGTGFDRVDYAFDGPVTAGITVDMAAGIVAGDAEFTGTDTIRGIESVRGSYLNDSYDATGFSGASTNAGSLGTFNEFEGMAGDDTVIGNGNTRVSYIFAREGVSVDLADGTAVGGASVGADIFQGGVNAVRGSNFNDVLTGSNNGAGTTELFEGRGGDDVIIGGGGFDIARYDLDPTHGGILVVTAMINSLTRTVTGDAAIIGTDTLIDVASVRGTDFNDTYDATGYGSLVSGAFNEFEGRGGNDIITGNGFTRVSFLNAGSEVTVNLAMGTASGATTGNDSLSNVFSVRGSNFGDTLFGSAFNDTLEGRGGDDTLVGSQGDDVLLGGDGDDLLRGGLGADRLQGGPGSDTFDFDLLAEGLDTILDFEAGPGGDVLDIADLLASIGYAGGALGDFVRFGAVDGHALLQIDPDGLSSAEDWQTLAILNGVAGLDLGTLQSEGNLLI